MAVLQAKERPSNRNISPRSATIGYVNSGPVAGDFVVGASRVEMRERDQAVLVVEQVDVITIHNGYHLVQTLATRPRFKRWPVPSLLQVSDP
jgi:hypothetical protein